MNPTTTISATVNGEPHQLAARTTLHDLVASVTGHTDPPTGVAAAVDGEVWPRTRWHDAVPDGSRVEILTAVQGG